MKDPHVSDMWFLAHGCGVMSAKGEGDTECAVLGFTGRWGIRCLCTQPLFLPHCQPVRLCPPAQPRPLLLLTCLLTRGDTASSE